MARTTEQAAQASNMDALEREMLALLIAGAEDAEGHLAFALHRRAVLDWLEAFEETEGRSPDSGEMRLFLLGEKSERRLASYREQAALMISVPVEAPTPALVMPSKKPQRMRTWFWPWGFSTGFAVENPEQPLNWKGLLWRLLVLGLAVVVTALALRIFVVRS
ncbi:MAG: hypothetical protein ACRDBL_00110 [Rhabdaerophilum sp.]